jgi:hypothetical protein
MAAIPTLRNDGKFEINLGYTVIACLQKNPINKQTKKQTSKKGPFSEN